MDRHAYNIMIFRDTMNTCKDDEYLRDMINNSIRKQRIYHANDKINPDFLLQKNNSNVNITVTKNRTLEAASKYAYDYYSKTVVLNFADFYKPGGLVEAGSSAQEEALCRISTLYPCITHESMKEGFYNLHRNSDINCLYNNDLIYTPDVVVVKNDDKDMDALSFEEWYSVDVITCAAPNLRDKEIDDKLLFNTHKSRFTRILEVAQANSADNVILGAFGCGAFRNDPYIVAEAAKAAITEYCNKNPLAFKNIEFAVYCSSYDMENYKAFAEVFSGEEFEHYDPYDFDDIGDDR